MPNTHHTKVLILGSGAAGCTAAIYAARASLSPIMVHGMQPGGQLTITTDVENFPGFEHAVQGPWLMEQMEKQAAHVGTAIMHDSIMKIDLSQRPFTATGESGDIYTGDTLIIGTGASARWLGIESEKAFQGFGVSACATCDGFFFKNKDVVVIGGGNSAVEEALYLANIAAKVTLIHRRDSLRAEKIGQERLFAHPKISVIWDSAPAPRNRHRLPASASKTPKPAHYRKSPPTARSSPSATRPTPSCSKASSPPMRTVISSPLPAARAPTSPVFSPPATCRIKFFAKPSPQPAPAAWPRWKPNAF
jgi:hypothetical protein